MTWINLGNPYPRSEPQQYRPLEWPQGRRIALPEQIAATSKPFSQVAMGRRTRYEFGPVSHSMLGSLLGLTCRVQSCGNEQLGFALSKRPAPSAGAIHPIHVIVHENADGTWYRYDPMDHALVELPSAVQPKEVRVAMNQIVQGDNATMLLFVAEPGKTFAKYVDACSLVWRDAGVLLGCFALAAEALELNFLPLGVTGEPWVSQLINETGLVGVGVAFVGSAPCGTL